jgi:hypothetical protein
LITIFEGTPDAASLNQSETSSLDEIDSSQLVDSSAEIIAAVERAVESAGLEFAPLFRLARVELGDDYPFIDPTVGGFEYADGKVVLTANSSRIALQQALIKCLRRLVDQVARNNGEARFRERVAVELAVTARRKAGWLGEFEPQLDRIAGTRVL